MAAWGRSTRNLVPSDPPLVFEEVMELEYPIVLLEPLAFVLNRMLEHLCARLQARALAAQELHLELTLENGRGDTDATLTQFQRTLHLPVPLLDAKTFLKLLQLDLKANPPGAPVAKVYLRIEPAKPRPAQNGLFMPASPEPEKLELTLARISAVVGEGRVGSPALLDTHRREAFEVRHFVPSESTARSNGHLAAVRRRPELHNHAGGDCHRAENSSSADCRPCEPQQGSAFTCHVPKTQTDFWRNTVGRWAVALIRRLVGAGCMGAG